MKPKPTSAAERAGPRFVIVTLDNHLAGAVDRARRALEMDIPGLDLSFHAAAEWNDPAALQRCLASIARGGHHRRDDAVHGGACAGGAFGDPGAP